MVKAASVKRIFPFEAYKFIALSAASIFPFTATSPLFSEYIPTESVPDTLISTSPVPEEVKVP